MSDKPIPSRADLSAAEHALRLLTGDEARQAAERAAADPAFAREVARWRGRLAPLAQEIEPVAPPAQLWQRIAAETASESGANDNDTMLRRQLTAWKSAAAGLGVLAASLALVLAAGLRPFAAPSAPAQAQSAPLVALLADDSGRSNVVASWSPAARQLVLAVPTSLQGDAAHSHELWVIPAGGKPHSVGIMPARKQMHMQLDVAAAVLLGQGATLAISVEPRGGSPTGQPTGPVIASGKLVTA